MLVVFSLTYWRLCLLSCPKLPAFDSVSNRAPALRMQAQVFDNIRVSL